MGSWLQKEVIAWAAVLRDRCERISERKSPLLLSRIGQDTILVIRILRLGGEFLRTPSSLEATSMFSKQTWPKLVDYMAGCSSRDMCEGMEMASISE